MFEDLNKAFDEFEAKEKAASTGEALTAKQVTKLKTATDSDNVNLDEFDELYDGLDDEPEDRGGAPEWGNERHLHIPGSYAVGFDDVAKKLFGTVAKGLEFFSRGKQMVTIAPDNVLDIVNEQALRSIPIDYFEKVLAVNSRWNPKTKQVDFWTKKANMSRDLCGALLANRNLSLLSELNMIVSSPVLYENSLGEPTIHNEGYLDWAGGIYVVGGYSEKMALSDAVKAIEEVLQDFAFASEADKTRAISCILTPCLVQSGFIVDRVPGDFTEADESQAGKGYRHDLTIAIYNETPAVVSQRVGGGTGSFDEFFGDALLKGRTFIRLDNLRGRLDSPSLESFFTAPYGSEFLARGFRKSGYVQSGRYVLQASSNGLESTRDLANRMCIVRIRKQPRNYRFATFPEGDMLERIKANPGRYLGAVHTIIGEWVRRGKLRTTETRHDFRKWAQILDWIMRNIFKRNDLLDGHLEVQHRVSTPIMTVLRDLAFQADKAGRLDEAMRAIELVSFAEEYDIHIPNMRGHDDDQRARWLGMQLGAAFKEAESETLVIDEYRFRREMRDVVRAGEGYKPTKYYTFEKLSEEKCPY
jgi:hypothetical protein